VAKRLVEMHGGTVVAKSDGPGQGSEFVVRLPLLDAATEPGVVANEEALERARQPRRVLVVDDNVDGATTFGAMLRLLGYAVEVATDGMAALEIADRFHPDVVLLDIAMPTLDGYQVARRLRASSAGVAMVLIAITGWGQEEDRRRTAEAGFDHHLVKPVDPGALAKLLAEI
jgi:CheY-like chemotaxis protein